MAVFSAIILSAAASSAQEGAFLRILSPVDNQVLPGPDVTVQFEVRGIKLGPGGCNLHFMLDNEPFEVQFEPRHPHLFHDVPPGTHTIRVYAATAAHEAIPEVYDMVTFCVGYGDERNAPENQEPLLTYNLPQGEYRGIDAADITLNFFVKGACLSRKDYRVQYFVDGKRFLVHDCASRHITGLEPGKHTVKVQLIDTYGKVVPGPFNSVERVIVASPDKLPHRLAPGEKAPEQPVVTSIHGAMTAGLPSEPFIVTKRKPAEARKPSTSITVSPESDYIEPGPITPRIVEEVAEAAPEKPVVRVKSAAPAAVIAMSESEPPEDDAPADETDAPADRDETPAKEKSNAPAKPGAKAKAKATSRTLERALRDMRPREAATTATLRAVSVSTTGAVIKRDKPAGRKKDQVPQEPSEIRKARKNKDADKATETGKSEDKEDRREAPATSNTDKPKEE